MGGRECWKNESPEIKGVVWSPNRPTHQKVVINVFLTETELQHGTSIFSFAGVFYLVFSVGNKKYCDIS